MQNEILGYIKQARAEGVSDEQIFQALIGAGWQEADIQEAFRLNVRQEVFSSSETSVSAYDNEIKNTSKINRRGIFIIVAIIVFLCAGAVFAMKYLGKNKVTEVEKEKQTKNITVPLVENNIVSENKPSSTSFDCRTDKSCMIQYAEKCQRAMGITLICEDKSLPCEENNPNYKLYKSEDYIFGGTTTACKYQSELVFMIGTRDSMVLPVKGLILTCTLTSNEITQIYSGGQLSPDIMSKKCSGTWVEYIKQQMNPKFLPINSSVSIEVDECIYVGGRPRGVQENNTACASNETDIGTIIKDDSGKAFTQCCKIK